MRYEYTCPTCYVTVYVERSIHAESSPPACNDCSKKMNRVWDLPSISFKGSGFYSTDKK